MASTLVVFAFKASVLILLCVLVHQLMCRLCRRVYKYRARLTGKIFWNLVIEFFNETYSLLAICSFLNLYFWS